MPYNHTIPQLIIKRFSETRFVFNNEKKTIISNKNPKKIFGKEDIYSDEIEKRLANECECWFAKLLDEKVLRREKILLTRLELQKFKQYLLITSIRTMGSKGFVKIMKSFTNNTEIYASLCSRKSLFETVPSINDSELNDKDLYMQTLSMYLDNNNVYSYFAHKYALKESIAWAIVFLESYVNFFDSSDEQDFLFTDCGMVTEYEPSHHLFKGLSLSKEAYLYSKINESKVSNLKSNCYFNNLLTSKIMYENFNFFTLSKNRCIAIINPFFRLYAGKFITTNGDISEIESPDVWPTVFETKGIISVPDNIYKIHNLHTMDDKFIYTPIKISTFDTIYYNQLQIKNCDKLIAFNNYEKVKESFNVATLIYSLNNENLYESSNRNPLGTLTDLIINSDFAYITNHFNSTDNDNVVYSSLKFINLHSERTFLDVFSNRYVLEYLLANENFIRNSDIFSFIGNSEEVIELFKQKLSNIK